MKSARACLGLMFVAQVGCSGGTTDEATPTQNEQTLTGPYTVDSSCSAAAQDLIQRAMRLGRIASASKGFQKCVSNLAVGTPNAAAPYYPQCNPSDPDVQLGIATQVADLLKWTQVANPLAISCNSNLGNENAQAFVGNFNTSQEALTFSNWINGVVGKIGSNPADPNWPLSQAAGIIWHEVMHNYGYQHPSTCSDPTYGPLYNFQGNTIPYIVQGCMSVAVSTAGNVCQNVQCPPDSVAMLTDFATTNCECVADPGTMNTETAFRGNNGDLWEDGPVWSGNTDTKGAIAPGSSPSIAALNDDRYIVAFEGSSNNYLWLSGTRNTWSQNTFGMMQKTSPSVTGLFGGYATGSYEVAFQANTGELWVTGTAGTGSLGLGMMASTSPSIAGLTNGGYEVAFQANTGELWIAGSAGTGSLGLGMMAGTSPTITALTNGGYEIAFQANTGELWVAGSAGTGPTGYMVQAGTSPSIAGLTTGGFEVAFQMRDPNAWLGIYGTLGSGNTWYGMKKGTNPSIAALPRGGYEIAFQDNTGYLYYAGTWINKRSTAFLGNNSSPSIAGLLVLM